MLNRRPELDPETCMGARKLRHPGRTEHEARNLVLAMNEILVRVPREETARSARAERSFRVARPSVSGAV